MEKIREIDQKIKEMAGRIRELREIEGLTVSEMAKETGTLWENTTPSTSLNHCVSSYMAKLIYDVTNAKK